MRLVTSFLLVFVVAGVFVPSALALRFTDESYFVPIGAVGEPYSHWFRGDGGCGPGLPYQFRILSGALPPGLSLSKQGHLSGTPTQSGSWSFWVELSDQDPPEADWCRPEQAEREFTVTIRGGSPPPPPPPTLPPLAVEQAAIPGATVGSAYRTRLSASGGGSQSWSVVSGALPGGVTLAGDGTLAGTPAAEGSFTFTVRVSDGGGRTATRQLTLVVRRALVISVSQPLRLAAEDAPMRPVTVGASGGVSPYRFGLTGNLPTGVQLDPASGEISGTPDYRGRYGVVVSVTDAEGRTASTRVELRVMRPVAIVRPRIGVLRLGRPMSYRFSTVGGAGKMRFTVERGRLPRGMRLNVNGVLVGRPKERGVFRLVVRVVDGFKLSARRYTVFSVR